MSNLPPIPIPTGNLKSIVDTLTAMRQHALSLGGQTPPAKQPYNNRVLPSPIAPRQPVHEVRWEEEKRIMEDVKYINPKDPEQYIVMQETKHLVLKDSITGERWVYHRDNEATRVGPTGPRRKPKQPKPPKPTGPTGSTGTGGKVQFGVDFVVKAPIGIDNYSFVEDVSLFGCGTLLSPPTGWAGSRVVNPPFPGSGLSNESIFGTMFGCPSQPSPLSAYGNMSFEPLFPLTAGPGPWTNIILIDSGPSDGGTTFTIRYLILGPVVTF